MNDVHVRRPNKSNSSSATQVNHTFSNFKQIHLKLRLSDEMASECNLSDILKYKKQSRVTNITLNSSPGQTVVCTFESVHKVSIESYLPTSVAVVCHFNSCNFVTIDNLMNFSYYDDVHDMFGHHEECNFVLNFNSNRVTWPSFICSSIWSLKKASRETNELLQRANVFSAVPLMVIGLALIFVTSKYDLL